MGTDYCLADEKNSKQLMIQIENCVGINQRIRESQVCRNVS